MNQPKDIADYVQCVRFTGNALFIYCVECNAWRTVAVHARGNVMFVQQVGKRGLIKDVDQCFCCCRSCEANIDYLLQSEHRQFIANYFGISL